MARKWGWFSAVKKAISTSDSHKDQKNHKLKTTWSAEPADLQPALSSKEEPTFDVTPSLPSIGTDQKEISEEINVGTIKQAYWVDDATAAVAADAQDDAAEVTEGVVYRTSPPHYLLGKTKEEIAAIKIQTAFRGYLARRTLHALRGLMRLKTLTQGHSVKQQATTSLRCMQTLAKAQSQIRERRIRMCEENQSLQRQQRTHVKELDKPQTTVGEDWDDSTKSKEEMEARLLDRKEAAMRREKARAYSSIHQQTWKKQQQQPPKTGNKASTASMNPEWSWSWGERWIGSRPWDEKELASGSVADRRHAQKPSRPPTPHSAVASSASAGGKEKPRQLHRRHSIAGLSITDDEDREASSSGKAKHSTAPSKLLALSPNRTSPFSSKRHSCPPQILLNHQMPCP